MPDAGRAELTARIVAAGDVEWTTRPHEPGEPARHTAELSERAGIAHTRANLWRYEPGARGLIHVPAGTPLQAANEGDADLLLYAYGFPPDEGATVLPDAV